MRHFETDQVFEQREPGVQEDRYRVDVYRGYSVGITPLWLGSGTVDAPNLNLLDMWHRRQRA